MSSIQNKTRFYEITEEGEVLKLWDSIRKYENETGVHRSRVHQSFRSYSCKCNGNYLRKIDYNNIKDMKIVDLDLFKKESYYRSLKPTKQLDMNMNVVKIWDSRTAVCDEFGIPASTLSTSIKNKKICKGFYWSN